MNNLKSLISSNPRTAIAVTAGVALVGAGAVFAYKKGVLKMAASEEVAEFEEVIPEESVNA